MQPEIFLHIPSVRDTFIPKLRKLKVHFIAMGGSVMHQLAIALKQKGYLVSGSDDEIFEPAFSNLAKAGLLPEEFGWFPKKIDNQLDAIILGMHARIDNPELQQARELGIPIYSFPEYIYQESKGKTRVVIGGSHGKTTTTSMIMHVLRQAGRKFDWLVGAKLDGFLQSVQITDAPLIVCEGDEYPASPIEKRPKFHFLYPHIAVLTGIAWDHINVFPTFDFYLAQFQIFIDKIEPGGMLIYNETDPVLRNLVEAYQRPIRMIPYGIPIHTISAGLTRVELDGIQGNLLVFGDHNLLNLNAAYQVCLACGIETHKFLEAIGGFSGASKRLELLGGNDKTRIYRDFAHAPSKVHATIAAVSQQFPSRKLVAVLELHTYSSLNAQFLDQYQGSLDQAELAAVFYSSHALAVKKMPPLTKGKIQEGFNKPGLEVFSDRDDLINWLKQQSFENATLLLMSSGNFDGIDILTFAREITARPI